MAEYLIRQLKLRKGKRWCQNIVWYRLSFSFANNHYLIPKDENLVLAQGGGPVYFQGGYFRFSVRKIA
jgi:hypothetical protein